MRQLSISFLHKQLLVAQLHYPDMHKEASMRNSGSISLEINNKTGKVRLITHLGMYIPKEEYTTIATCKPMDFTKDNSSVTPDLTDNKYVVTDEGRTLKSDYYEELDFSTAIIDGMLLMNKEFNKVAHKLNPHWEIT